MFGNIYNLQDHSFRKIRGFVRFNVVFLYFQACICGSTYSTVSWNGSWEVSGAMVSRKSTASNSGKQALNVLLV